MKQYFSTLKPCFYAWSSGLNCKWKLCWCTLTLDPIMNPIRKVANRHIISKVLAEPFSSRACSNVSDYRMCPMVWSSFLMITFFSFYWRSENLNLESRKKRKWENITFIFVLLLWGLSLFKNDMDSPKAWEYFFSSNSFSGFVCINKQQKSGPCLDYQVRFCCPSKGRATWFHSKHCDGWQETTFKL